MDRHRIDLWLKLVCLFKHRGDATEACRGGKVKVNGLRVKPAASVKVGDVVELYDSGDRYRRLVVQGVPETNVSKDTARTMYADETPALERLPPPPVARERGAGRPTKKDRREIAALRDRKA
jgi:ribosome-associated heat shock protein Hsp15